MVVWNVFFERKYFDEMRIVIKNISKKSFGLLHRIKLSWPLDEAMTDTELQRLMFSKENKVDNIVENIVV